MRRLGRVVVAMVLSASALMGVGGVANAATSRAVVASTSTGDRTTPAWSLPVVPSTAVHVGWVVDADGHMIATTGWSIDEEGRVVVAGRVVADHGWVVVGERRSVEARSGDSYERVTAGDRVRK